MKNDKRAEVMLNRSLWWALKEIANEKHQTFSALVREVFSEYINDYEQTTKETGVKPVRKE